MTTKSPIPTPLGQKLKRARVGALPLVIWCVAVLVAIDLWRAGPSTSAYVGLARSPEFNVASPVDGKLDGLLVELFQTVGKGDALGTINDAALEASVATAQAELDQLAAELRAERANLEAEEQTLRHEADYRHGLAMSTASLEFPAELRAFHADEAGINLNLLEITLATTISELEADRIEVRLRRAQALVGHASGPVADVEDLEKLLSQERARVTGLRIVGAGLRAQRAEARERRNAVLTGYEAPPVQNFVDSALETRLSGWRAALEVQRKRMQELALTRKSYVLRAPAAGRVSALVASQGQFLLAGDPILVLTDSESIDVALWVPESSPTTPRLGDRFRVRRALGAPVNVASECVVQAVSPKLEIMPQRLWRNVQVTEFGRACLIGPVAALMLIPGERVHIDPLPRDETN